MKDWQSGTVIFLTTIRTIIHMLQVDPKIKIAIFAMLSAYFIWRQAFIQLHFPIDET